MSLQIDLKPISENEPYTSYFIHIYANGSCYKGIISQEQVMLMVEDKVVRQVDYQVEINGKLETKHYSNKVDGAGVQYTSKVYQIKQEE